MRQRLVRATTFAACVLIVVFITLFAMRLRTAPSPRWTCRHHRPKGRTQPVTGSGPSIAVVAIFKNEAHILNEWCAHYFREGISHIYLINDQSSDMWEPEIQEFGDRITSVVTDDSWTLAHGHRQKYFYNKFCSKVKEHHDWLAVLDLDEFMYSRPPYPTIQAYLTTLPGRIGQIEVLWAPFGSSGYDRSPPSVVKYYKWRGRMPESVQRLLPEIRFVPNFKAIIRTNNFDRLWVHRAQTKGLDKLRMLGAADDPLKLNHYQIQSKEFWTNKMKRGSVRGRKHDHARTWQKFHKMDYKDVYDTELANKTYA